MGKLILIIIAFFISPLAVFLVDGIGKRFWLNVILYICGVVPGVVHGIYVVLTD